MYNLDTRISNYESYDWVVDPSTGGTALDVGHIHSHIHTYIAHARHNNKIVNIILQIGFTSHIILEWPMKKFL